MYRWWVFLFCVSLFGKLSYQFNRTEFINKIFNRPQESVSQFPPILEFFVQKIQSHYSNYVYEDLSRPPTWDTPVYTLAPEDQAALLSSSSTANTNHFNEDDFEYVDTDNSTEIFFEIIVNENGHSSESSNSVDNTNEKLFETINTVEYPNTSETLVYITPKKAYTTTPKVLPV